MNKPAIDPIALFEEERREAIETYGGKSEWQELTGRWMDHAFRNKYMYNFSWLGRPIIQLPADMLAFQEIVWDTRPDLIIEMGIAHGGSLVLSASMLALLDHCDAAERGETIDPRTPKRRVLGVDIDIRAHNRAKIENHPLSHSIDMIEGSSIEDETIEKVRKIAEGYERVLVCLDSNHTHDHVLAELNAYAPLVTKGSYCITFDTIVEDLPDDMFPDRPWSRGNNPKTAVHAYLKQIQETPVTAEDGDPLDLIIDKSIEDKLLMSGLPDGFLKRV